MKKTMKTLFAVVLAVVMTLSLVAFAACGETIDCSKGHVDADKDGVCDVCKATIVKAVDCSEGHVDANNDQVCDNCKAAIAKAFVDAGTCQHEDNLPAAASEDEEAGDGKCDKCGLDMNLYKRGTCVAHIDLNNDGACDFCQAVIATVSTDWNKDITAVELSADSYSATAATKATMTGGGECDAIVNLIVTKGTDGSYTADLQVLWNVYGGVVKWAYMYTNQSTIPEGFETAPAILGGLGGNNLTCQGVVKNDNNVYTATFAYKYFGMVDLTISIDFVVDATGNMTAYFVGIGGMDLTVMNMGFISVDRAINLPVILTTPQTAE